MTKKTGPFQVQFGLPAGRRELQRIIPCRLGQGRLNLTHWREGVSSGGLQVFRFNGF